MLMANKNISSNVIPLRGQDDIDRKILQNSIGDVSTGLKDQLIEVQRYKTSISVLDEAIQRLRASVLDYQAGLKRLKVGSLRRRANRLYSIMNRAEQSYARS
jgi:hypothetical protein